MLTIFTVGAAANAGRSILMRLSGQRIVARLRRDTYASALRQEVEYVERGEGDIISRLSVDSSIVGESCVLSRSICQARNEPMKMMFVSNGSVG